LEASLGRASHAEQRLIQTAVQLLCENGYASVGVDAICRRARVNKGSFYYFFPSKADLTLAAMRAAWSDFERSVLESSLLSPLPPRERLIQLFHRVADRNSAAFAQTGKTRGCFFGSLGNELSGVDDRLRAEAAAILEQLENHFRQLIREISILDNIEPANPDEAARALLAYFEGALLLARTRNDPDLIRSLAPMALQIAMPTPTSSTANLPSVSPAIHPTSSIALPNTPHANRTPAHPSATSSPAPPDEASLQKSRSATQESEPHPPAPGILAPSLDFLD